MASATDPGHLQVPKPTRLEDAGVDIHDVNNGNPVWRKLLCCPRNRREIFFSTYEEMAKNEEFQKRVTNGEEINENVVWTKWLPRPDDAEFWASSQEVQAQWLDHDNMKVTNREFRHVNKEDLRNKFVDITPGIRRIFVAGIGSMFHKQGTVQANIRQHLLVYEICQAVVSAADIQENKLGKEAPGIDIYFEDGWYTQRDTNFIADQFSNLSDRVKSHVGFSGEGWSKLHESGETLFITLRPSNPYRELMADFLQTERAGKTPPKKPIAVICRKGTDILERDHSNSRVVDWLGTYTNNPIITDSDAPIMGETLLHY